MNRPTRRVGLSAKQPTRSLLQNIKRPGPVNVPKPKVSIALDAPPMASSDEEDESQDAAEGSTKSPMSIPKLKAHKSWGAPPIASSDEEENSFVLTENPTKSLPINKKAVSGQQLGRRGNSYGSLSDSSDGGRNSRACIKRSVFTASKSQDGSLRNQAAKPTSRTVDMKRSKDSAAVVPKRRKLSVSSNDEGKFSSSNSKVQLSSQPPPSSGEHLMDDNGFTKKSKAKVTYRKKFPSSQESRGKTGSDKRIAQVLDFDDSPQKEKSYSFRIPEGISFESPPKSSETRTLNIEHLGGHETKDDHLASPSSKRQFNTFALKELPDKPTRGRRRQKNLKRTSLSQSPPPPTFMIPAQLPDFDAPINHKQRTNDRARVENDSSADSDASLRLSRTTHQETAADVLAPECPWCGETVEQSVLDEFSKGKRMNVRMQTKFCQVHKKRTAMETWKMREYPDIEWDTLEDRFEKHREFLLGIINGDSSHYRSILAGHIEAGRARDMKKEGDQNPGYYGSRGFNLMCDYLVREFGSLLKKRAVDDRVISGRGPAAFIQGVLVSELGVCLIQDDMGASSRSARVILEESKSLGGMVHDEL